MATRVTNGDDRNSSAHRIRAAQVGTVSNSFTLVGLLSDDLWVWDMSATCQLYGKKRSRYA